MNKIHHTVVPLISVHSDFFQYDDELTVGEAIESTYIMWKSEKHILIPRFKNSFVFPYSMI